LISAYQPRQGNKVATGDYGMTANRDSPEVVHGMTANKDSSEVVKFMLLFKKLKNWSDDDPGALPGLANKDESIKDLCAALLEAAQRLRMTERNDRKLFTAPVDPKFIIAWRDFEERFEAAVSYPMIKQEGGWEQADFNAFMSASLIEATIELASSRADGDKSEIGFEFYTIEDPRHDPMFTAKDSVF
jgi:hypothetical protein